MKASRRWAIGGAAVLSMAAAATAVPLEAASPTVALPPDPPLLAGRVFKLNFKAFPLSPSDYQDSNLNLWIDTQTGTGTGTASFAGRLIAFDPQSTASDNLTDHQQQQPVTGQITRAGGASLAGGYSYAVTFSTSSSSEQATFSNAMFSGSVYAPYQQPNQPKVMAFIAGSYTFSVSVLPNAPSFPIGPRPFCASEFTPTPPHIASFTGAPSQVDIGRPTTLSWSIDQGTNQAAVTLSWLDGNAQKHTALGLPLQGKSYDNPTVATTYTLTASNNLGQTSATVTVSINPPTISTFKATPSDFGSNSAYINRGDTATLIWGVVNCQTGCNVSLQGSTDSGQLVLSRGHLPASGQLSVKPTETTHYTLTAQAPAGAASKKVDVAVYVPSGGGGGCTYFYFQMKNSSSTVTPCFGVAVCAADADTAKKIAEQENQGYTATEVSYQQFVQGCS